jgi:hypothetical protein
MLGPALLVAVGDRYGHDDGVADRDGDVADGQVLGGEPCRAIVGDARINPRTHRPDLDQALTSSPELVTPGV